MVCDFCHEREADYDAEVIYGGQRHKIHICMKCAIERGINPDTKIFEASLGALFNEFAATSKKIEQENNKMCPVCGTSLADIKKSGRTGCPECYAIFKDSIQNYLATKGISGPYTGSMPARLASFHSVLNDRIALQNKLNDAVAHEDYEKAAMYRDYLHALEKHPVSGDNLLPGADGGAV